ncbi:hypothetical protein BMS3Bbin06_00989 [bacterium BMS3Bbin06]|nr:hypothetical protein BMS3Abin08_01836 [bacterium BMS3Abin08]GBE34464.1 hypothetical protein BMS3Bbin06_00989 [bacterium BMS3Bbin06]HDO35690.1 hypothetical protein [Nitrospirota bacterium]HDY71132.1 hypothetical protein [Nitrospirota bacterium]
MKADILTKVLLIIGAVLLAANLVSGMLSSTPASAEQGSEIGRYQISAWSARASVYTHHSGYYIVDTTTGKVVASKSEVHTAEK